MKKKTRLHFTHEDYAGSSLRKTNKRTEKEMSNVEPACSKRTKKTAPKNKRTFEKQGSKSNVRLNFEDSQKKKLPSKLAYSVSRFSNASIRSPFCEELDEEEKENVGVEATHSIAKSNEAIASNPLSYWYRKRAIKKQYLLARKNESNIQASKNITAIVKSNVTKSVNSISKFVTSTIKEPKTILFIGTALAVFFMFFSIMSSAIILLQGSMQNIISTSYTAEETDIKSVDKAYTEMETTLRNRIENIEAEFNNYDKYNYDIDYIGHDSHQLTAYLMALLQHYDVESGSKEIESIFEEQYTLTIASEVEKRYKNVKKSDTYIDENGEIQTYTYTARESYNYYILNVKLENLSLQSIVESNLNEEQLKMYNLYIETKGNNPLLFEDE